MKCRILLRARDVATKFSQSRLGLWPVCVRISTMSPLASRVRSGTIRPLTRAPTHWWPTSVWIEVGEVHRRRAARQRLDLALRREDVDLLRVELDPQVLHELLRVAHFLLRSRAAAAASGSTARRVRRRRGLPCISSAPRCPPRRSGASPRCGSAPRTAGRARPRPTCAATGSRSAAASR